MSDDRDMGVGFGDLSEDLADEDYPISHDELLERYGDRELDLAQGSTTLREVVGPEGNDSYEDADEVHQTVLNMVGDEAIGRKDYTDRSPDARGEEYDEQSF